MSAHPAEPWTRAQARADATEQIGYSSVVASDRDEARCLRDTEDGGWWQRVAGAVVADEDMPTMNEWGEY